MFTKPCNLRPVIILVQPTPYVTDAPENYLFTIACQASPPNAPRIIETGGGEPYHSVAVKAPTAITPHHGSAVKGPLTVPDTVPSGERPEAGV